MVFSDVMFFTTVSLRSISELNFHEMVKLAGISSPQMKKLWTERHTLCVTKQESWTGTAYIP